VLAKKGSPNKGGDDGPLVAPSKSISISFQKGAIEGCIIGIFVYFIHTRKQGEGGRGERVGYKISQEKGM